MFSNPSSALQFIIMYQYNLANDTQWSSNNFDIISTSPSILRFWFLRVIHVICTRSSFVLLIDTDSRQKWFLRATFEYRSINLHRYLSSRELFSNITTFYCYIWLHIQTLISIP
jgi:hypothetical protein